MTTPYQLRTDIERVRLGEFALPLGIVPTGPMRAPTQGYTITYTAGEDDESDTYTFHVVVSHERLAPIARDALGLLPDVVFPIVEISSRDAYRTVDVYMAVEPLAREEFCAQWTVLEPILLEDCSLAAGAASEDPALEVFVDQWKGLTIAAPLDLRDDIEAMLQQAGLSEVQETWPADLDLTAGELAEAEIRPILLSDENDNTPDLDDLLLDLRQLWGLELNIDPDNNVDEAGRELGLTLWHAMAIVEDASSESGAEALVSIWATAGSLSEMEGLVDQAITREQNWLYVELFAIDRVAYDERPDELIDLPPKRDAPAIHHIERGPWHDITEVDAANSDWIDPGPHRPNDDGGASRRP